MTPQAHGEEALRAVASAFEHDIFVVHAAADEPFVQGYLLPELGLPPDRVLVPGTLRLGRSLLAEITPRASGTPLPASPSRPRSRIRGPW